MVNWATNYALFRLLRHNTILSVYLFSGLDNAHNDSTALFWVSAWSVPLHLRSSKNRMDSLVEPLKLITSKKHGTNHSLPSHAGCAGLSKRMTKQFPLTLIFLPLPLWKDCSEIFCDCRVDWCRHFYLISKDKQWQGLTITHEPSSRSPLSVVLNGHCPQMLE